MGIDRIIAVAVLIALSLSVGSSEAAVRVDLDGAWRFRTDPASRTSADRNAATSPSGYDISARAYDASWLAAMREVQVPHTWAIGPDRDFHGVGWYSKTFILSPEMARQHVELNFGAAFSVSHVWVNGAAVGGHVGGFTAFALDLGKAVHVGENTILVAVDDRPGFATVPGYAMRLQAGGSVAYDWVPNGGLVRDVWLTIAQGGLIRRQRLTSQIAPASATLQDEITVHNVTDVASAYRLTVVATAPDGTIAATAQTQITLPAGATGQGTTTLQIPHPELWNVAAAKLYTVTATLSDAKGQALDSHADTYGLRTIEIRDRRLYVNGHPVRLTGVTRHEDSPWEGLAETRGTILHDWDDLAALHVTLTRPVHYPQPPEVLDAADRAGILLIPEIPVWGMIEAQLRDPRLIAAAKQMMTEMVEQDANHPSIFAWSVCNESYASTPGGEAYVKTMKALVNRIDPGRFVSFADAAVSTKPWVREAVMDDVDFIMANAYFGTWSGAADDVKPWLDFMDKAYPNKMVVISEFGWPGPFSKDSATADRDRTENLREQLAAFQAAPFVGGAIFWTYQDYRSHLNLWPGETDGYVDHGLVDENRQRRPSYAAWELRNRPLDTDVSWRVGASGLEGFKATLRPNGPPQLPSYPLIGYRARWRVVSDTGVVLDRGEAALDLAGVVDFARTWSPKTDLDTAKLTLDVLTPEGIRAGGAELEYRPLRFGFMPFPPDPTQLPPAEMKP